MAETSALFPPDARDKLTLRLQNAVNGFVDSPRTAVESADRILEEAIADLTRTLAERRQALRTTWSPDASPGVPSQGAPSHGVTPQGLPAQPPGPAPAPGAPAAPATPVDPAATPAPASAATAGGPTAGATPPPTASPAEGVTGVSHAKYSTDDTEQLRLALRDYRETAERLLRL